MLNNCYLPDWVHRLANGVMAGLLSLLALVVAVGAFGAPPDMLWVAPTLALGALALDPRRFTLVEGCAGDLGHDQLLDEGAGKPEDGTEADTFDIGNV